MVAKEEVLEEGMAEVPVAEMGVASVVVMVVVLVAEREGGGAGAACHRLWQRVLRRL